MEIKTNMNLWEKYGKTRVYLNNGKRINHFDFTDMLAGKEKTYPHQALPVGWKYDVKNGTHRFENNGDWIELS